MSQPLNNEQKIFKMSEIDPSFFDEYPPKSNEETEQKQIYKIIINKDELNNDDDDGISTKLLKQISGGDTIYAKELFLIDCQKLPIINPTDPSIKSRIKVVKNVDD